jgi:hypothetical protein
VQPRAQSSQVMMKSNEQKLLSQKLEHFAMDKRGRQSKNMMISGQQTSLNAD